MSPPAGARVKAAPKSAWVMARKLLPGMSELARISYFWRFAASSERNQPETSMGVAVVLRSSIQLPAGSEVLLITSLIRMESGLKPASAPPGPPPGTLLARQAALAPSAALVDVAGLITTSEN